MAVEKRYVVYRIKNNINGRVYFGSTQHYKSRVQEHLKVMSGKRTTGLPNYLRDIRNLKHRPEDFTFRVLGRFDNQIDMLEREQLFLDMYWGTVNCYNSAFEVHPGWVKKFLVVWNMQTLETRIYLSCHAVRKDLGIPKLESMAMLAGEQIHSGFWVVERWGKRRTVVEVLKLYRRCKVKLPEHAMEPKKKGSITPIPGYCSIAELVYRKHFHRTSMHTGEHFIKLLPNHAEQFW